MEILSPSERKKNKARDRRNLLNSERKAAQVRIANERFPEYAKLVDVAETDDFKEWFYNLNGYDLGNMLYEEPEDTIRYIQRTYDREIKRNAPKNETLLAYFARRRIKLKQATPPWYDKKKHQELIDLRKEMNERHPNKAPYHIDHIIPLNGIHVSGLNIHTNMQVIPGRENNIKSNKFDI